MVWCLMIPSALCAVMAYLILTAQRPRWNPSQVHPGRIVRGCVATFFLFWAVFFGGIALWAWYPPQ